MSARAECLPCGGVEPWQLALRSAERYGRLAEQVESAGGHCRLGSTEVYRRLERVFLNEAVRLRSRSVSGSCPV